MSISTLFTSSPEPLTARQRTAFRVIAIVCALSRFAAMARSLWDWDEALFCLGLRSYDVTNHRPHPPGFPVYIGLGHIARLFTHDDFRALQSINLLAGMLVFPAIFLLARELRFRFETSLLAAMLCAFFPNVWYFGGGAFSDVPSIVLVVFAVALLLRGMRNANAYIGGAFLLGLAVGIRPQNVIVGLFAALLATWYRARSSWRDVVFAALVGGGIVVVAFGGAIAATGSFASYMHAIHVHGEYIARIDSFRSPVRPALWRLLWLFFVRQYESAPLGYIVTMLVCISAITAIRRRDGRVAALALTFLPFCLFAWLMLDRYSVSRFSIGYCPLFAILAADGISRIAAWLMRGRGAASPETRAFTLAYSLGGALTLVFALWTWPALTAVRHDLSPTVRAVSAAKAQLDPKCDQLYVAFGMTRFVDYLAPELPYIRVESERGLPLSSTPGRGQWLLAEKVYTVPGERVFARDHDHLWNIARRQYFEVSLAPFAAQPEMLAGWYKPEHGDREEWRWTEPHSVTRLPAASGEMILHLSVDVPHELLPKKPTVTITLNGSIIERFQPTEFQFSRDFHVTPAPNDAPNILELNIDRSLNPAREHISDDIRDLGLLVRELSWGKP